MELIYKNPARGILKLRETSKERGILNLDEIRALFGERSLVEVWDGNLKYFTATMLSLVTGMRQGKVLGLQVKSVFKDHVAVVVSWDAKNLIFKDPKWQL